MDKHYDFNHLIDRREDSGTYSIKWQGYGARFPGYNIDVENTIGMWIADMDFYTSKEVMNAVKARAAHGIYGYTSLEAVDRFKEASAGWFKRRYNYDANVDWMIFGIGVVPILNTIIQEFTDLGDGVIIQQPVYYPFTDGVVNCGRKLRINQLIEKDGHYTINFEELEKLAKEDSTKLLILCSPHNPVGRVWTKDELTRVCEICCDNDVLIVSDEIHADFIFKGQTFISAGRLSDRINDNLIITFAPSKTFNIAGLGVSCIVVPNLEIKERLEKRMLMNRYPNSNVFGPIAGEAAYLHGDSYVDQLVKYVEGNIDYAIDYIEKYLPNIELKKPQGTYLVWFDFRKTGLDERAIYSAILEEAKVAVDIGQWFGAGGEGFARFNFACPRSTVENAMKRLRKVFGS